MKKINWYLLNVISFGSLYFYSKKKAKRQVKSVNKELKTSRKINFEINDLLEGIGGKNNIKTISTSLSSLKINVIDKEKINISLLKNKCCKGIMQSGNNITLIFGDNSKRIAELITH